MIIGFADMTGRGHLTSQLSFLAVLFTCFSDKKHLLISRKPEKTEYYLGIVAEDAEKKRNDLMRLAVNGQLTTQLLKDYSIPLARNLDYLDASYIDEKEAEYRQALFEYLLEKAGEGYHYVFADLRSEIEFSRSTDKTVICFPQSMAIMREYQSRSWESWSDHLPLLVFGQYFPESKWTKNRLSKGIPAADIIGLNFSYELFDAFNQGNILDYLNRKQNNWEKTYRSFAKFISAGEVRPT